MIFTLDTERIRRFSRSYDNPRNMERRFHLNRCSELLAYNGNYEYVQILVDNKQTDHVLQLGVSSYTRKSIYKSDFRALLGII